MKTNIRDIAFSIGNEAEVQGFIKQVSIFVNVQISTIERDESFLKFFQEEKEKFITREVLFEKYDSIRYLKRLLNEYSCNKIIMQRWQKK